MGRLLVAQHVEQHRGEAVDGIGRLPGAGGEVLHREGEESPIGHRMAIDQQQGRLASSSWGRHNAEL